MSGSLRSSTMQSKSLVLQETQRFFTRGDGRGVYIAVSDQFHHAHPLYVVVFDHQQFSNPPLGKVSNVVEGLMQVLMRDWFLHVIKGALFAARAAALPRP